MVEEDSVSNPNGPRFNAQLHIMYIKQFYLAIRLSDKKMSGLNHRMFSIKSRNVTDLIR
jgi:hypothetical protein